MEYGIHVHDASPLPPDPREVCTASWRSILPGGPLRALYFGSEGILPETLERYAFWKWTLNHSGCRTGNRYPMGPRGLCAIARLLASGISSFKVVGREASLARKAASVRIAALALRLAKAGAETQDIREAVVALRGSPQMCEEQHLCYYPDLWQHKEFAC